MKSNSNRRIVLSRLGGIGDVIHTLPLAEYLKRKYPNSSIEYITSEDIADLLMNHCTFIDKAWTFRKEKKASIAKDILRNGKIDYFFNLHSSLSFFFFNLFYIRAQKYFHYKKDITQHAILNFARTCDSNISTSDIKPNVLFSNNEKELLNKYGLKAGKYICLVPGVGKVRIHRAWPFEKWTSLAEEILNEDKEIKIVFLGGKDEKKDKRYEEESFKDRIVNLIGELTLSEDAKIISQSQCLISCDTGLLHLASALSKNVIGLYGPTLPERSGPFNINSKTVKANNCECIGSFKDIKNCKKTKSPFGYCMNNLTVEAVKNELQYIDAVGSK